MFEALKKKLASWLGKPEEKKEKKAKKKEKKVKKEKKSKKEEKKNKKKQETASILSKLKKEILEDKKIINEEAEEIEKIEEEVEEIAEEDKEEELEEKDEDLIEQLTEEKPKEEKESEITEEKQPEEKKINFFSKLFSKLQSKKITQEDFDKIFMELELILLENNVALEVVDKIKKDLSNSLIGTEVKRDNLENLIINFLKDSILDVLIEPQDIIEKIQNKKDEPYVILFFGINGSGKTTSIAKLAYKLKNQNIPVVLAAADTFRAASIEQLKTHGERLQVPVISKDYGSDPSAVCFDAISYAKKNNIKVVLIDTAGRMYTKQNLMKEMEKIVRISKPDLKIFVGESITGNDGVEQAKMFNETAGIDGIILSKADVDEKAGTILSVSYVTKKPIYFLGVGQEYKDLKPFKKEEVLKHLGL